MSASDLRKREQLTSEIADYFGIHLTKSAKPTQANSLAGNCQDATYYQTESVKTDGRTHINMSQSFTKLTYHVVFATKNRTPQLTKEIRPRLYEYCGGITRNLNGVLIEIGGIEDHVHALVSLLQNMKLAEFAQKFKANSSRWLNETLLQNFTWQAGYGAFTVSESQIERVRNYIRNQELHHRKHGSFENEFENLLEAHNIDYNRNYLWQ